MEPSIPLSTATASFVLEGVARQSSVVHFDVHLEIFVQIVSLQEADNGFGVYIILVFL